MNFTEVTKKGKGTLLKKWALGLIELNLLDNFDLVLMEFKLGFAEVNWLFSQKLKKKCFFYWNDNSR